MRSWGFKCKKKRVTQHTTVQRQIHSVPAGRMAEVLTAHHTHILSTKKKKHNLDP